MDGNGRWAKQRTLPRIAGHRAGVDALRSIVRECGRLGIQALTVFVFSSENWRRPNQEVGLLMELFMTALEREIDELHKSNVRMRVVGNLADFPDALQRKIAASEEKTAANEGLNLTLAANYGGQWDITEAARRLGRRIEDGEMRAADINQAELAACMSLADLPAPDLFIRTGGEQRISNFLLWQLAYTEMVFTEILWPDFGPAALAEALEDYAGRQRRFGRTGEQVEREKSA